MKKRSRETQILRPGCSKTEPKMEIVATFTYKPSLVKNNAPNFELPW